MPSRIALLSFFMLAAACGPQSETAEHHQQLTTCEGLDRTSCEAQSTCVVQELACLAVCVDPGDGGCESPCGPSFVCVARPATPVACESLDVATCGNRSDCEVITAACEASCADDGLGGCLPCNAPSMCVTRQVNPINCYGLDPNACDLHPECEFIASPCGDCPDTAICSCNTEPSCQPRQVEPTNCFAVSDENTCNQMPGCEFVLRDCDCSGALCDCPGFATCQPIEPTNCFAVSDENTCNQTPGCEFVLRDCDCSGALCDCPGSATCQPIIPQPPVSCYGLSPDQCDLHPECDFYSVVCDCTGALCDCPSIEPSCQPRQSPCTGLDATSCNTDSRCEMMVYACPQVCIEDVANPGTCLPCEVPPPSCIEHQDTPVVGCGGGGSQPPSP